MSLHFQNLLVSGDAAGVVHFSAFGTCAFGQIDVSSAIATSKTASSDAAASTATSASSSSAASCILHVRASPSLDALVVAASDWHNDSVRVLCFKTRIFARRAPELTGVASHVNSVAFLVSYVLDTLQTIKTTWTNGRSIVTRKFGPFAALAAKYSLTPPTFAQAFTAFAVCGVPSQAVVQFASSYLAKQGIERMQHNVFQTCTHLLAVIADAFEPALQQLIFRLGEVRALAVRS